MAKRTILHIDSSARVARSHSRRLSKLFVDAWLTERGQDDVIYRDVGTNPPPFMTQNWIAAAFTRPEARSEAMKATLAFSDELIDEIEKADVIVLGAPMYNYNMPAALKAWFDQIARIGRTFSFDLERGDFPIEPILGGKTLVVLSSRGEFGFEDGVRRHMNALDPGIAACAHYLGASEIHTISAEFEEFGGERRAKSVEAAEAKAKALASSIASVLKAAA
ncbi:FMN-dependent NADH-azoreductase [Mesorhizobium sp. INR15]|uniref:FMN-dependent NADH-azoreductase n=1 Tax=Mesorhizobium sp. INR15 TaxID=2654248 RepID=UPI00189680AB|nr:NAD(P)H-dependent oxidoreductase [Mesorhizobium sp. INR15]QPC94569.1 FMN-dependent NADH-azoreductase [Mesorhizobium sp. INR15]